LRSAFHDRMHRRGEPATLHVPGTERTVSGTVRGITDDGALLLDTDAGRRAVYAGDVTSHSPR
jgi:BirA family biotin operon repressor/biotin-[acetyl-CoA-carboxylase] ligase